MLPIGISAPPQRLRPWVTGALVLACVAVFTYVQTLADPPPALFCSDLTESAQAVERSARTVQGFVCRYGSIPDEVHEGREVVTLLTAVFVHAGWFHLLTNMLFLLAFAPRVEEDLGHAGLLAVFGLSGVLGGLVHVLVTPNNTDPSIGASGAVAGVLGAHLLLSRGATVRVLIGPVPLRLPSRFVILLWAGLQAVYTALVLSRAEYPGGVSYEVHVAGFVVGLVLTGGFLGLPQVRSRSQEARSERLQQSAGDVQ